MKEDQVYLGHRICESLALRTDTVVFATVCKDDKAFRAFAEKHAPVVSPGASWDMATILPWESSGVVSVSVYIIEDIHFSQLVMIWKALSSIVRQRSIPSPPPLVDAQWARLQPVLYHQARRGRRRRDNRALFEATLDVILRGTDWSKGSLAPGAAIATVWRRYKEWEGDGKWASAWQTYVETLELPERVTLALNFLDCSHPPQRRPQRKRDDNEDATR
jgi:hypothetical protein